MSYTKPKKLQMGDLIGLISPASAPFDFKLVKNGEKYFEELGYRTILGNNVGKIRGYLAGTDEERIRDIHQMFDNKKVKAIFCLRGGYGAFRLIDRLDYRLIQNNPKIFVGFSEITALQMAILKKSTLVTFAGPMVVSNFSKNRCEFTTKNFWSILTSNKKPKRVIFSGKHLLSNIKSGEVTGEIIGGNLSVFTSLIGTGYLPDLKNKILMLEEIKEPPYKIDRMFNQLRLNNVFAKVNGIVLGNFIDCEETDKKKNSLTLEEVFADYFNKLKIPVISWIPHGHSKRMITMPIGIKLKIDMNKKHIDFLESGVR